MTRHTIFATLIAIATFLPGAAFAADFEISGWIPYWRSTAGVASVLPNLDTFTEINPFMYTVKEDGSLNQASSLTSQEWVDLRNKAKELNVRFVPTIMWAGADAMQSVLSNPTKRAAHIQAIAQEVFKYNLDGIDIDYEGKKAETRVYFSQFLKELEEAIGYNKWIMCTVESRTPLDSRYSSPEAIPTDIEYSNDFTEINKYCDRVRIMTYDQGRIDLKLDAANADPYIPVSDVAWVEKVMRLIMQEVSPDKLEIGVPTYGYEWDMFQALDGSGKLEYSMLWALNPGYGTDTAMKLGLTPVRNSAGELMITYPASQSPDPVIPLPNATRVMVWSDAVAIQQKIDLAKRLGVRGVSIFKIDGGQDPNIYSMLLAYKTSHTSTTPAIVPETGSGSGTGTGSSGSGSSAGTTTGVPTRNLQTGSTGEDVRMLQKFLNAKGFTVATTGAGSPGNETTMFGAATRAAVIKFQKAYKISPAVGYFGPLTRARALTI